MRHHEHRRLLAQEDGAAEILEFLALLPILMFVGLVIWQLLIGGHAIVVGANAAREGARYLAACDASKGAAEQQARYAAPEFDGRISASGQPAGDGGQVHMTVTIKVPLVLSQWVSGGTDIPITFHATMRKEMCNYN